ncbi:ATPase [Methanobacterium spitsbergense]|uniref:ATPase n=1 Tax=Methanobacterium spitsbergense TaxID=2874285 RepID=UPI001CBACDDB|nr:ATPase [Methanobacterium spitsbergense]
MNPKQINRDVIKFLHQIGVDTRFISIIDEHILINNQRFSRFSNKRQETFIKKFPSFSISRSKIFQKICTRASRILANSLKPGERIFIIENDKCSNFILDVIIEPYKRKYGIEIIYGNDLEDANKHNADSVALPLNLDDEVQKILGKILNGEKIEVYSLKNRYDTENNLKLIYPLINVPRSWLVSWLEKLDFEYKYSNESTESDLIEFFEGFIPDVRENILKSALYVDKESIQ